jgi:hypothetical protein
MLSRVFIVVPWSAVSGGNGFISLRLNVPVEGHVQIAIRNQPSSYTRNPGWFGAAVFLEICIHQKVPAAVFVVFSHHVPCC